MKLSLIITVMVIMLTSMVAAAEAAPPPFGTTFCTGATCVTPVDGTQPDGSVWVFRWATDPANPLEPAPMVRVGNEWRGWIYFDHFNQHRRDFDPQDSFERVSSWARFNDAGAYLGDVYGMPSVELHPELNNADCGRLQAASTAGAPTIVEAGPGVATDAAMRHSCYPETFGLRGEWLTAPATDPNCSDPEDDVNQDGVCDTKPAVAAPAKLQSCRAITVAKRRVAVTSTGVGCTGARNTLARYMRTGKQPRGWVCTRLAAGKARVASCGTPSRSAKRIIGRWRA